MLALLTATHLLIAIVLILIVLLQSSRGTDIAGAFGGMGSQAAFGPRGTATFLSKATIILAAAFMVNAVALSIMGSRGGAGNGSVLSDEPVGPPPSAQPASAAPAPPSPQPAGAPAVQLDTQGLEGMKATVTVENPGEAPNPNTPAATVQTVPAPTPAPGTSAINPAASTETPSAPAPSGP